ncbi:hypothetical protein C4D60_Mb11t18320 [Musa balbisiana]|uniref:Uncharacterized protein n=1 Tax=Musa balbisiana TaxID=52838 RepID=A0A4S8J7H9_MUSBA|nr:hypothetical protein C4D60_Mb11t18320 [Musa balbisiana]
MAEVMEALHHLTALARPHHGCSTRGVAAVRLPGHDHRVDDLVAGVVNRQHLEPSQVRRLHHRVQEGPGAVGAPHHQDGARGHVARDVLDHPDLLVVANPHQRRKEHHVEPPQFVGHAEHVRRVERHAGRHVGVAAQQPTGPIVGGRVEIVVVELRRRHVLLGQHDGGGELFQCNLFHHASMAEVMEALHHLTALARPHHGCSTRGVAAVRLPGHDHRVDDLVAGVVNRQHLEPSQVRRLHHRVQEGPGAVGAPHHQDGARGHVARDVLDHPDLLVVANPHQRRKEHHVEPPQFVGHAEHVRRVERHAGRHVGVAAQQPTGPIVGGRVEIVVVELRRRHVLLGQHDGGQRQRAGADERHPARRARHVPHQ